MVMIVMESSRGYHGRIELMILMSTIEKNGESDGNGAARMKRKQRNKWEKARPPGSGGNEQLQAVTRLFWD